MNLKGIFKIIKPRLKKWELEQHGEIINGDLVSLAELLADPEWCKAVWGDSELEHIDSFPDVLKEAIRNTGLNQPWKNESKKCFETLRDKGSQEAIEYIYNTMKK